MSNFKFSNFQPSPIVIGGTTWPTVEHYYQAMKTSDPADQRKIRKLDTPGKAKRAGRKVKMRPDWEKVKEGFMMTGLRAKYASPDFKKSLTTTEGEIVEFNKWHDNEWGSCICVKCRHKEGKNKLGKLLMKLREELK